jgi:hypothetical protein
MGINYRATQSFTVVYNTECLNLTQSKFNARC